MQPRTAPSSRPSRILFIATSEYRTPVSYRSARAPLVLRREKDRHAQREVAEHQPNHEPMLVEEAPQALQHAFGADRDRFVVEEARDVLGESLRVGVAVLGSGSAGFRDD